MPQFSYTFSDPANSSFTVTTTDTPQTYTINGGQYTGYAVTGISGTFNGQQISGTLGPGGQESFDDDSNGGGVGGYYDNTIFVDSNQGYLGSLNGIDGDGLGFRAGPADSPTDYTIYESGGQFFYQSNGEKNLATLASSDAPCFTTGTLIRTARGEVAVEALQVGDLAVTASGAHKPIRWIGSRTLDPRRHSKPQDAQPVRIRAGALSENRPTRDLRVSPGHGIAVDVLGEVLIPACALVNGATIVQEEVESVTYWHVELDSHDLLLAEGQAAESYLDLGNRGFFAEGAVVALDAGPDAGPAPRTHADFCRPFHDGGALVDVVRAQMRLRAEAQGWRLDAPAPFAGVHLEVDGQVLRPRIRGLTACFVLPAGAREVRLVSPTGVPRHVDTSGDARALGLCLSGLRLVDSFGEMRTVALDDPLLGEGFHSVEPDHRWTAGRVLLPSALFADGEGTMLLRLDLDRASLPRWVAPEAADARVGAAEDVRLLAAA